MRPIADMPAATAAGITTVLCDIDDTLTSDGRLPACAYQAIEDLAAAGIRVAPITGRPAGWCDMIARFWPVAGVVGENGAFYFAYHTARHRMTRVFAVGEHERQAHRAGLERIRARVLEEVPGCAISADQAFRLADLAVDFCEDVAALSEGEVARIKAIFEEEGATAKVSSIHVNGWYGTYDKLTMSRIFARDVLDIDLEADRARVVFVGDSPNDAPMFGYFPNAVGVANVCRFAGRIEHLPCWVTGAEGGQGFTEVARRLLSERSA